jgi:maltose/maltodextrin transport system substrate-binding protein
VKPRHLAAAVLTLLAAAAGAQPTPRLLVWINGDKGYNGLQKVGDAFTAATGVPVVVQHPEGAPDKFQAAAARRQGPGHLLLAARPRGRVGQVRAGRAGAPGPAVRDAIDDAAWPPSPTAARPGATRWPSRPSA